MDWFTNSKQNEIKRLINQFADELKRDVAAQELIKLSPDSIPTLIESLQSPDLKLILPIQNVLARIPSATPQLTKS